MFVRLRLLCAWAVWSSLRRVLRSGDKIVHVQKSVEQSATPIP